MANFSEKRLLFPKVTDFYEGKSILLTGAAGFVGAVMLEILLRSFPNISAIYIVLREKKGVSPQKRKEALLNRKIFVKLKKQYPDAVNKVHVISGDVSLPNFGMSEEALEEVVQNVTIVFHCAACISFMKPLRYILANNAGGTWNAIQICKKLKQLDVFLYTSTAYSNSNRNVEIEEQVYRLPYPAKRFLDALHNGTDDELQQLVLQCQPKWPNYYTFSKCLAENIIQDMASNMPVVIIRPSVIFTVWKAPLPGYIEENSSMAQLAIGCGKGFVKVIYGSPDAYLDLIPVDVVVNAHIVSAWRLATVRSPSPLIVNCTSRGSLDLSLRKFHSHLYEFMQKYPLPKSFKYTNGVFIVNNYPLYALLTAYEHYIPAFALDFVLKITGNKTRLVRLYRFYDKAAITTHYFASNNWSYETKNLKSLDELDPEDRKMFYTDLTGYTIEKVSEDLPSGAPLMDWSMDKKSKEQRMKVITKRYFFSRFVQYTVLYSIFCMIYMIFSIVFCLG